MEPLNKVGQSRRTPSQFVYEMKLRHRDGDPHRQLVAGTTHLKPGTIVRVHTGSVEPTPNGDYSWFRSEITFQFVEQQSSRVLNEWRLLVSYLEGEK